MPSAQCRSIGREIGTIRGRTNKPPPLERKHIVWLQCSRPSRHHCILGHNLCSTVTSGDVDILHVDTRPRETVAASQPRLVGSAAGGIRSDSLGIVGHRRNVTKWQVLASWRWRPHPITSRTKPNAGKTKTSCSLLGYMSFSIFALLA